MGELRRSHLRLVNALLAICVVVLPVVSWFWPVRVPPPAVAAICVLFLWTIHAQSTGRIDTARAAQILVVSGGVLVLGGTLLHLINAPDPAAAYAAETYNISRAMIILTGGAYVTLGREKGRQAALAALGIWMVFLLSTIQQIGHLDVLSAVVLRPLLDMLVTTVLVGVLFDVAALNARHLQESRRDAKRLAEVDALTGVQNRHGAAPAMQDALTRPGEAALIVLDLDNFKRINDTHGHAGGDQILRQVGSAIAAEAREGDCVGRWGGEEFVVVLRAGGLVAGERVARKVRAAIHDIRADFPVSASFGVAVARADDTVESLFKRADGACYLAKENGRDRIVLACENGDLVDLTHEAAKNAADVSREKLLERSRQRALRN